MGKRRITIIDGLKWCPYCEREVPIAQFGYRSRTYDHLSNWCKPCLNADAAYRRIFSDKYKAWYKRYYTPERMKDKYKAQKALWKRRMCT